ncbi:MAG TPA: hypothetical protein VF297_18270 [Pyrinomonadaceae bacterium]
MADEHANTEQIKQELDALEQKVLVHIQNDQAERACPELERMLELDRTAETAAWIHECFYISGRTARGMALHLRALERAVELLPERADFWNALGRGYEWELCGALSHPGYRPKLDADTAYQEAIRLAPADSDPLYSYMSYLFDEERFEEAADCLRLYESRFTVPEDYTVDALHTFMKVCDALGDSEGVRRWFVPFEEKLVAHRSYVYDEGEELQALLDRHGLHLQPFIDQTGDEPLRELLEKLGLEEPSAPSKPGRIH